MLFTPQANNPDIVKIKSGDLKPGMFICGLDRPWRGTPFPEQGFNIHSLPDVATVRRYCDFVLVDMSRSMAASETRQVWTPDTSLERNIDPLRMQAVRDAEQTRIQTMNLVRDLAADIQHGQALNVQLAKAAVAECVSKVISKREAMLLLAQMRDRDELSRQQAYNCCIYSIALGRALGLKNNQLEQLGTAALLHDIGKLLVPAYIINKTSPLTEEEHEMMRAHTLEGRNLLISSTGLYSGSVDVAYNHHENLDGTGYPRGLMAHQIPLFCKIVAVVDKYDAITSPRPHRGMGDHLTATNILKKLAKLEKIDNEIVSGLINLLGVFPPGTVVKLSSGEIAIVIDTNPTEGLRPKLLVVRDQGDEPCCRFLDLAVNGQDEKGRPLRVANVCNPKLHSIKVKDYFDFLVKHFN